LESFLEPLIELETLLTNPFRIGFSKVKMQFHAEFHGKADLLFNV
jgi:hypothetical protein